MADGRLGTKNSKSAERKLVDASAVRYIVRWAAKGLIKYSNNIFQQKHIRCFTKLSLSNKLLL